MCGILGGWQGDWRLEEETLDLALERLRHRGPDDAGRHRQGQAFLGMRRLSIIDLGGGHQPVFNEDGSVAVVFNGEIYNYLELIPELKARGHTVRTHSDTEVLVHLYEDLGEGMLSHLRGMFAFAIYDARHQRLFVARDRFGKKPLYYTQPRRGGLLFASEIKALRPLAKAAGETWNLDEEALYDYLSLGVVPQPGSIYCEVRMLPPGSWMFFDGQTPTVRSYWSLDYRSEEAPGYAEALEGIRQHLAEAVRIRLRCDVPLGVFLSGGIDSSVVALEAARTVGAKLQTYTVAVEDTALDESPVAQRTARFLGVSHTVLRLSYSPVEKLQELVRQYDQPFADSSAIPSMAISQLARQHVTVVLNGDGGDEIFAGYRRHLAVGRLALLQRQPRWLIHLLAGGLRPLVTRRRSPLGLVARLYRGLEMAPADRYLAWTTDMFTEADKARWWQGMPQRSTESWLAGVIRNDLDPLRAQMDADVRVNLLSGLLVKMDMATMAYSLEARSPLLDHKLAEYVAGLPSDYLLRGGGEPRPRCVMHTGTSFPRRSSKGPSGASRFPWPGGCKGRWPRWWGIPWVRLLPGCVRIMRTRRSRLCSRAVPTASATGPTWSMRC